MSAHPCIRVAFLTKESHDLHLLGVGAGKGMGGLWQLEYWGAGRRGHRGGGVAGYSPPPAVSTQRLRVWVRAILPAGCGFRTRRWQGGAENRPWGPGLELLVLPAAGATTPEARIWCFPDDSGGRVGSTGGRAACVPRGAYPVTRGLAWCLLWAPGLDVHTPASQPKPGAPGPPSRGRSTEGPQQGELHAEAASCRRLWGVAEAPCPDEAPRHLVSGALTQTFPNLVPEGVALLTFAVAVNQA